MLGFKTKKGNECKGVNRETRQGADKRTGEGGR